MTAPGRGDGMLDIHGKCRREREELEAKLAEARAEDYDLPSLGKVVAEMVTIRRRQYDQLMAIVTAARQWREAESASPYLGTRPEDLELIAAVDAEYAWADDPSPVGASGRTSNEDGADVGATWDSRCNHLYGDPPGMGLMQCTKRRRHSGPHHNGSVTWTMTDHRESPADSRAGQAGEEVAGT